VIVVGVDATSEFGSVAVRRDFRTVAELEVRSTDGFGHVIFQAIRQVLADAGVRLEEVDCFASASGPGSFTGVRVGLAAVKGLAEAAGKGAAAISSLRALSSFGTAERRAVVMDARRGEVFAGVYNSRLEPERPERLVRATEWQGGMAGDYEVIDYRQRRGEILLATGVAFCAELDWRKRGCWEDPASLDANYVRDSDAELTLQS
jgi:tRNA threonylcarbamoyladenosine biosynthesis protein TsaB